MQNDDGRLYGVHFTNSVIERYRQLGDHVTFLMRSRHLSAAHGHPTEITAPNFNFVEVDDIVNPLSKLRYLAKARRVIRQAVEDCSLVVARVPSAVSTETVRIARELEKPCLVECVACNFDALWNYNWKGKLGALWYAKKQRHLLWDAPFVVYVTNSFLQSRYPTQGETACISNVAIGQVCKSDLHYRIQAIEQLKRSGRPMRIATIGDLNVPYKSQSDVIRALARLSREGIACEYHLIGGGDPSRLESLISKVGVKSQVIIHGTVPHADIFSLLRTMDLYVHPSRQEGLPRALIESFSVGLPAIGSSVGGIPELLPPERLFTPGDIDTIMRLVKLMQSKEVLDRDAEKNWIRSHDFQSSLLEARRVDFFNHFLEFYGFRKTL